MGKKKSALESLLSAYRFWGIMATASFLVFLGLLCIVARREGPLDLPLLFADLVVGFLWIGTTSISRHVLIVLKGYIGKKVTALEFLSTQFIVILFPFAYGKVKKQAEMYMKRKTVEEKVLREC